MVKLHKRKPPGDIHVFLTDMEEESKQGLSLAPLPMYDFLAAEGVQAYRQGHQECSGGQ